MSQENVELARRAVDAVNQRDLDRFLALMDENVECVSRIAALEGGLHGHEGARRWWHAWYEAFPDYQIEVIEMRDMGDDAVVACGRAVGHAAGSALPVEDTFWQASKWRQGKCIWWRVVSTEGEALEAVGLAE